MQVTMNPLVGLVLGTTALGIGLAGYWQAAGWFVFGYGVANILALAFGYIQYRRHLKRMDADITAALDAFRDGLRAQQH